MFDATESVVRREMHAGCSEKRVNGCGVRGFEEETKQKKQQEETEGGVYCERTSRDAVCLRSLMPSATSSKLSL